MNVIIDENDLNILLSTLQAQREESRQHRQTIFNTFSLSVTGFMVIFGAVISINYNISLGIKMVVILSVITICYGIIWFIQQQRYESEKAMEIVRKIENHIGLFKEGRFIPELTLLPDEFNKPRKGGFCFTKADVFHRIFLITLSLFIIVILIMRG